jgi:hypothetical protein
MAKANKEPKSYEYTASEVDSSEPARPVRSLGSKVASIATSAVLVVGGIAGGAAFAMNVGAASAFDNAPNLAGDNAGPGGQQGHIPDGGPGAPSKPGPGAGNQNSGQPSGSGQNGNGSGSNGSGGTTIAVPPVTFNDDGGGRDFHDDNANGKDDNGDDSGSNGFGGSSGKHHPKTHPTTSPTTLPSFGSGSDDNSDDNSGSDD